MAIAASHRTLIGDVHLRVACLNHRRCPSLSRLTTPSSSRRGNTIITTCKNLGIDPRCYIRDTLRRILDGEKNLDALLPENYRPSSTVNSLDDARTPQVAA